MNLAGRGLLLVWTDVAPEAEADFNAWYDRDHLRERVEGVPGIGRGRRFVAEAGGPKYLTAYDLTNAAVMRTEPYLDLRRQRDPESRRLIPQFRNTLKLVGRVAAGFERAEGALCLMVRPAAGATEARSMPPEALERIVARASSIEGIVAARLGSSDAALVAQTRTFTTRATDRFLDWVLMIEATDEAVLQPLEAEFTVASDLVLARTRFRIGMHAPQR